MNLKKIVAAGVAAVCAVSMAACGGSNDSSGVTDLTYDKIKLGETGKDITASIKFYNGRTDMGLDSYPGKNWKSYIADFNKIYPNIKVEAQTDTNYADNALTRLQGGDWGDIMMIPSVDKSELENYFISYGSLDTMQKQVKLASEKAYDGKSYGVATDGQTSGVVYNKAVFKKAGITELPTTPEEFIADLKLIKEKTDAIPLYTNYAAGFTMGAWDAYIGTTATGDTKYMNQKLVHTKAPFKDPGDGTHAYNVYKILYDAVADGLTEEDYSTTDWESSKSMINNGQIATMVLGAWAVTQMQQAGDNADDIGYMPFPISIKGKQYASMGGNYSYARDLTTNTWTVTDKYTPGYPNEEQYYDQLRQLQVATDSALIINEICASNKTILADEDGEYSDWIEIYNSGSEAVNLKGYALSDSSSKPFKWKFPDVTIEPGAYMVVFASGKSRTDGQYLHTSFSLSSEVGSAAYQPERHHTRLGDIRPDSPRFDIRPQRIRPVADLRAGHPRLRQRAASHGNI